MERLNDIEWFNDLINALYTGPNQNPPWGTFLSKIKACTGSELAVVAFGERTQTNRINYVDGVPENDYSLPFLRLSPFTDIQTDEVVTLDDLTNERELMNSEFYHRCLEPMRMRHMIGVNFLKNDQEFAYIRLGRTPNLGSYTSQERKLFQLLLPHFHTVSKHIAINKSFLFQRESLFEAMENIGIGILVIDSNLHIQDCNHLAQQIIARSNKLTVKDFRLKAKTALYEKAIKEKLNDVVTGSETASLVLDSLSSDRTLITLKRHSAQPGLHRSNHILLYISDHRSCANISLPILRELFGFTLAESKIALALTTGLSIEQAAEIGKISKNTAYTHLKSAFAKAGVNQQSMLVCRILNSVATIA